MGVRAGSDTKGLFPPGTPLWWGVCVCVWCWRSGCLDVEKTVTTVRFPHERLLSVQTPTAPILVSRELTYIHGMAPLLQNPEGVTSAKRETRGAPSWGCVVVMNGLHDGSGVSWTCCGGCARTLSHYVVLLKLIQCNIQLYLNKKINYLE